MAEGHADLLNHLLDLHLEPAKPSSSSSRSRRLLCIRKLYTQPNVRGRELYLHCTGYIL